MSFRVALYLLGTPLLHLEVGAGDEHETETEDEEPGSSFSEVVESPPVGLGFSVTPLPGLEPEDWDE